jgi:hypothetical protein
MNKEAFESLQRQYAKLEDDYYVKKAEFEDKNKFSANRNQEILAFEWPPNSPVSYF